MDLTFIINNWEFFLFILFLTLFLIYYRKNLDLVGLFPFFYMLLYKTTWGLKQMDSWSKKHPKVFLYLGYFSFFIGVIGLFFSLIFMVWQLFFIVENQLTSGGGFVLPLQTESGMQGSIPIFHVPFIYWIISLFVLAVVHEFAHGVIGQRFKIKVKSSGFAFAGVIAPILPAAFVEPDEESYKKAKKWQQISMLGAGSTSNLLFGLLFLLMLIFVASPLVDKTTQIESINFYGISEQSYLANYNISSGEILKVNDIEEKEEIIRYFSQLKPNENISMLINSDGKINEYSIVTFENDLDSQRGMIGIIGIDIVTTNKDGFWYLGSICEVFAILLFWLSLLNIGIGIMNLLPLWITDGGKILYTLLSYKLSNEMSGIISSFISLFTFIIIIFSLWPSLLYSIFL